MKSNNEMAIEELNAAILEGDKEKVLALIAGGANINYLPGAGYTPLMQAVVTNDIELVSLLLECKADPNVAGRFGTFPLRKAVEGNNIELAKLLLEQGADPNYKEKDNFLLINAMCGGNPKLLELLLEYGANPNTVLGEWQKTPLEHAIEQKDMKAIELLLKYKANPDLKGDYSDSPLVGTVKANDMGMVKLLLKYGANPNLEDPHQIPLIMAIKEKNIELAELLLEYGADANYQPYGHRSPLHRAINTNNTDLAKLLLEHGANATKVELLIDAATDGNIELVKVLLKHGALLAEKDFDSIYGKKALDLNLLKNMANIAAKADALYQGDNNVTNMDQDLSQDLCEIFMDRFKHNYIKLGLPQNLPYNEYKNTVLDLARKLPEKLKNLIINPEGGNLIDQLKNTLDLANFINNKVADSNSPIEPGIRTLKIYEQMGCPEDLPWVLKYYPKVNRAQITDPTTWLNNFIKVNFFELTGICKNLSAKNPAEESPFSLLPKELIEKIASHSSLSEVKHSSSQPSLTAEDVTDPVDSLGSLSLDSLQPPLTVGDATDLINPLGSLPTETSELS